MEKESNNGKKKNSVHDIVTDQVIALLEKGVVLWKQPWAEREMPQNLLNRIPYKGMNMLLLSAMGFERNFFITPNQLKERGWKAKQGERAVPITFWKWPEKKEGEDLPTDEKVRPVLRYYLVYNISQCEGIPKNFIPPLDLKENNPIESCAKIVANMPNPPQIRHIDDKAYYMPLVDVVNVPDIKLFDCSESYYYSLFHELVHSTGHEKRLNRPEGMKNLAEGVEDYSQEELVAELGACFLEAHAGISEKKIEQNASYIQGWLNILKNDRRFIVFAASQAQKAADYILSTQFNGIEVPESEPKPDEEKPKRRPRGVKVSKKAEAEKHPIFTRR